MQELIKKPLTMSGAAEKNHLALVPEHFYNRGNNLSCSLKACCCTARRSVAALLIY